VSVQTGRGGRVPDRQPNSLPASRALRLCARHSHGVQEGLTQRRKGATSSGLVGAHFSSQTRPPRIPFFVFFRFFRPHRLSHVVMRSGFAEKNAKGAGIEGASRQRWSVLGVVMTCHRFRRGARRSPWRVRRPHATTQRREGVWAVSKH